MLYSIDLIIVIDAVYDDANAHKRLSLPVNASPLSASDTILSRVLIGEVILPLRFLTKGQQLDGRFLIYFLFFLQLNCYYYYYFRMVSVNC